MAVNCRAGLIADFGRVKELIGQQNYSEAHAYWNCSMGMRNFNVFKDNIRDMELGGNFVGSVVLLKQSLEVNDEYKIKLNASMLETFIAQIKLRKQTDASFR